MKLNKILFVLITGAIILMAGCSGIPGFEGDTIEEIEIIDSDHYSNYPESGVVQLVIKNKVEFVSEWKKVHKGTSPTPELPKVDFTSRTVVLIMLDGKPSGGYALSDIELINSDPNLLITYTETRRGSGCFTTAALTKPYAFVSIPSTAKPIQFQPNKPVIKNCN